MLEKQQKRMRRHKRLRAKIVGTAAIPRLCIFRSNKHTYAQLIDDEKGKTIISVKDSELNQKPKAQTKNEQKIPRGGKVLRAYEVGRLVAQKALGKKISRVVFDRGGYKYHGRVKAVADGAREEGLKF